jgi:dGTP triphosphohydrolase
MKQLAPYAAHIEESFGRLYHEAEPTTSYRNIYQCDRDRIISTHAFK